MHPFADYYSKINDIKQLAKIEEIVNWIENEFPELSERIAWNQPMFTHHGTFIFGMSISKKHISLSPELAGIIHFSEDIKKAGYEQTKYLFHIKWDQEVNYSLLKEIIEYNIQDKLDCTTFFRK